MAKTPKATTWTKVKVTSQKLPDPYNGSRGLVAIGDTMIVDDMQAEFLEASGMAEIVEEDVIPPWGAPAPAKPATVPVKASEAKP
jgi:hypothetical protein